jgi:hypothetical protein
VRRIDAPDGRGRHEGEGRIGIGDSHRFHDLKSSPCRAVFAA